MRVIAPMAALVLTMTTGPGSAQTVVSPRHSRQPLNVVLLIIDDARWDSIGAAGNKIVRTPRIDQLAGDGVRFAQARVTTSICMVSRATLLTAQYMSRHGITAFGRDIAPGAFANTFPAVLRRAGYWTGYVGKYGVGKPRAGDFDFLRAYEGTHWMTGPTGERVHVTEKNARDAIDFLQARPKDKAFSLTVGFFAAHATRDQFALNVDVAPTLVAAAGLPVPTVMQGRDLSPLYLEMRPPAWRDEFFYEHPTVLGKDRIPSSQAVIRKEWKYVEWPEFDYQQLFNLKDDPGEIRNLAGNPAHATLQRRMRQQLDAWRQRVR